MYKVTNKMKDVRKFRDNYSGKDILVGPRKSVLTMRPPEEGQVWKVEEVQEEKKKLKKEVDSNDSSSD